MFTAQYVTVWRHFMGQTCECYNMLPCEELSWMCRFASAFEQTA